MELIVYVVLLTILSIASFWIIGSIYGFFHRPAIYFPVALASKMAVCAVFGSLLFMVGGVILSTMVFNAEMKKRLDYTRWPALIAGATISMICICLIYVSAFYLAWQVFD